MATNSITLAELSQERHRAEERIREALDDFMKCTGLPVHALRVDFTQLASFGSRTQCIVSSVSIEVRL